MADIILKRAMTRRDLLRRYAIEIDGKTIGHIRAGATMHFKIAEGMRRVRLSIDGYGSPGRTILASDQSVIILRCGTGDVAVAPPRSTARAFSFTSHLPLNRTSYLSLDLERADEVARGFVRAAWTVAQYQIQERTRPGDRSRYGLTAGDLSVLYHGCRVANANLITTLGSANHCLWGELARIGWLTNGIVPAVHSDQAVAYRMTEPGRIELLEIFSGGDSKAIVLNRPADMSPDDTPPSFSKVKARSEPSLPPETIEAMQQTLYNWKHLGPDEVVSLRVGLTDASGTFEVASTSQANLFWAQVIGLGWIRRLADVHEDRQRLAWTGTGRAEFPNFAERYGLFHSAEHNHRLARRLTLEAPILAAIVARYETVANDRAVHDPVTGAIVRVRSTPEIETRRVDVEGLLAQTISWSITIYPADHKPAGMVNPQTIEILSGTIDFMFKRLVARGMLAKEEIHDRWELMLGGLIAFNRRWPLQKPSVIFSDYWSSRAHGALYPFSMPNPQEFEALCLLDHDPGADDPS